MEPKRIKEIYDSLVQYEIQLDPNPGALGPKYLFGLISRCRGYINAISFILLEVHREKHDKTEVLGRLEAAYAIASEDLLASDPIIRQAPAIDDRRAMVAVALRTQGNEIKVLKDELQSLGFLDKAIWHRHKELRDTMSEIKLQRSLLRDDIDTQAFYGDESGMSRGSAVPSMGGVAGIDEAELERIFEDVSAKANTEIAQEPKIETLSVPGMDSVPTEEEENIDRFLSEPVQKADEDLNENDLAEIFAKL